MTLVHNNQLFVRHCQQVSYLFLSGQSGQSWGHPLVKRKNAGRCHYSTILGAKARKLPLVNDE